MEFITSIDFTLVGLIICILYEIFGKGYMNYMAASTGNLKKEDINGGTCLLGLFYIVFIFVMLWSPYLWLPALLLICLGFLTGGITHRPMKRIKEARASGLNELHYSIAEPKTIAKTFWTLDKIFSVGLLGWMIFLHLQFLGIIA